jgi:hypothetical protein
MRMPDWQGRLLACLAAAENKPFAWGTHDCCVFAADCVQAVTGDDPLSHWRGRWRTERGAARVMRSVGGGGLAQAAETLARECGWPLVAVAQAQRGDVALAVIDAQPTILMCTGVHFVGPSATGWVRVPLSAVTKSWRVG